MSGRNDHNIPLIDGKRNEIEGDLSATFFDIEDFHVVVPMHRDKREIQRDITLVDIKRELSSAVVFRLWAFSYSIVLINPPIHQTLDISVLKHFFGENTLHILEIDSIVLCFGIILQEKYQK